METQIKTGAKDFIINLGAIIALYTSVASLIDLLFTIINTIYPQINYGYSYFGSESISWSVATLVIFSPIFILLMWLLEKDYRIFPEKQSSGIHRWFTYITLFLSGLAIAIDLITVLYYFLDGQELTAGFLLKVLVLLVVAGSIFAYYVSDVLGRLTSQSRKIWRIVAGVIVLGSIITGFAVLGSPATQSLYKYDEQKVNDLMTINSEIVNYYDTKGVLPRTLADLTASAYYINVTDSQTGKPYEYESTGENTYNICAVFNKSSKDKNNISQPEVLYQYGGVSWSHPEGRHCFQQTVNPNIYSKPVPFR